MQAVILNQKLKSLVQTERKITYEILLLIQTLDITKSFRELGYSSLFEYLTKEIGYSESSAQRRISSARLMKQVPEIANDLKSGKLNLTQVSLAQAAIRQEEKARSQNSSSTRLLNQDPSQDQLQSQSPKQTQAQSQKISLQQKIDILEKMKSKNTFETQKILKEAMPAFEMPKPKAIPAGDNKVHVTLQFSESDWEKVQALMAHFSHSIPDQKIESLLLYWQSQVEKKKQKQIGKIEKTNATDMTDLRNETRNQHKSIEEQNLKSSNILLPLRKWKENAVKGRRSYIPTSVQVLVRQKAQDRCEFVSQATGRRCESTHFLETEHRIPVGRMVAPMPFRISDSFVGRIMP